jgi:hypothetical protein
MSVLRAVLWGAVLTLTAAVLFFAYSYPVTETRRGRVLDESGRPVAGARVMLIVVLHDLGSLRAVRRVTAKTDANGAFEVASSWIAEIGGEPGRFLKYHVELEACHRDFVPVSVERSASPDELVLKFAPRPKDKADYRWGGYLNMNQEISEECRFAL